MPLPGRFVFPPSVHHAPCGSGGLFLTEAEHDPRNAKAMPKASIIEAIFCGILALSLSHHIMGAIFPDMVREIISDGMAEIGITEEDLRELIRKLESPAPDQ